MNLPPLLSTGKDTHTHTHTHTHTQMLIEYMLAHTVMATHKHREKQRDTHTRTPLLWQEQTLTQALKPDVIFHVPRPAVNVNYKPYDPKFGNLPNLCVTHDQKGDTCWLRHGICFSIKISITKLKQNTGF